jgi:DNA-binding response OmpR family regulator
MVRGTAYMTPQAHNPGMSTGGDEQLGPDQASGRPRVLVVDDSRAVRDLLVLNLELEGFDVRTASDGQEGVEVALDWHPDVVTLDVVMPRLDGFAALRALRADPRTASVPVALVTGRVQREDRALGEELGADAYLAKPFEPAELVAAVGDLARSGRRDRDAPSGR